MSEPTGDVGAVGPSVEADSGERTTTSEGIYGRYLAAEEEATRTLLELRDLFHDTRLTIPGLNRKLMGLPLDPDSTLNRRPVGSGHEGLLARDANDQSIKVKLIAIEEYDEKRSGVLIGPNGEEVEVSHDRQGQRSIAADPSQQAFIDEEVGERVYESWVKIKDPANPGLEVGYSDDGRAIYVVEGEGDKDTVYANWGINGLGQFNIHEVSTIGNPQAVSKGNVFDVVKRTIGFAKTAELKPAGAPFPVTAPTLETIPQEAPQAPVSTPAPAPVGPYSS